MKVYARYEANKDFQPHKLIRGLLQVRGLLIGEYSLKALPSSPHILSDASFIITLPHFIKHYATATSENNRIICLWKS
jgi:hypothetical protein